MIPLSYSVINARTENVIAKFMAVIHAQKFVAYLKSVEGPSQPAYDIVGDNGMLYPTPDAVRATQAPATASDAALPATLDEELQEIRKGWQDSEDDSPALPPATTRPAWNHYGETASGVEPGDSASANASGAKPLESDEWAEFSFSRPYRVRKSDRKVQFKISDVWFDDHKWPKGLDFFEKLLDEAIEGLKS